MLSFLIRHFFFFNDTATTEIYTLSLHDSLPIFRNFTQVGGQVGVEVGRAYEVAERLVGGDRKSTRLNSSHANISYAVFCLKKKKELTTVSTITRQHATSENDKS